MHNILSTLKYLYAIFYLNLKPIFNNIILLFLQPLLQIKIAIILWLNFNKLINPVIKNKILTNLLEIIKFIF